MPQPAKTGEATPLSAARNLLVTPDQLSSRDPVARVLLRLSHHSVIGAVLIALTIHGFVLLGIGSAISLFYPRAAGQFLPSTSPLAPLYVQTAFAISSVSGNPSTLQVFLSILDRHELPTAIVTLISGTVVWSFYVWQLNGVSQVFHELSRNGVIGKARRVSLGTFMQQTLIIPFNKAFNLIMALGATLAGMVVYLPHIGGPIDPLGFGYSIRWWQINRFYMWGLWIPLQCFTIYMVAWIVVRQIIVIISFTRLFNWFEISPKLFHPDQSNGLAPVGNYAIRFTSMIVFMGFWVSYFISFPILFGKPLNLTVTTILELTTYIVALPVLLIPPVWQAHLAMRKAKVESLEAVAVQIRTLLSEPDIEKGARSVETIEQLEKKYRLIDREHRTWPFNLPELRRFSVAAVMPLLSTAASFLVDIYLR